VVLTDLEWDIDFLGWLLPKYLGAIKSQYLYFSQVSKSQVGVGIPNKFPKSKSSLGLGPNCFQMSKSISSWISPLCLGCFLWFYVHWIPLSEFYLLICDNPSLPNVSDLCSNGYPHCQLILSWSITKILVEMFQASWHPSLKLQLSQLTLRY